MSTPDLSSAKDIAKVLEQVWCWDVSVRDVYRYISRATNPLPCRRKPGHTKGWIYAYRTEVEQWAIDASAKKCR